MSVGFNQQLWTWPEPLCPRGDPLTSEASMQGTFVGLSARTSTQERELIVYTRHSGSRAREFLHSRGESCSNSDLDRAGRQVTLRVVKLSEVHTTFSHGGKLATCAHTTQLLLSQPLVRVRFPYRQIVRPQVDSGHSPSAREPGVRARKSLGSRPTTDRRAITVIANDVLGSLHWPNISFGQGACTQGKTRLWGYPA